MSEETTTTTTTETPDESQTTTTSYLDGKYESVGALEDGYKELQSTFSKKTAEYKETLKGFAGSPEDYELGEGLSGNDIIASWGKDNGLTNDAYASLIENMSAAETESAKAYKAEQMEALGTNAETRINNASDWVRANLGEEAVESVNSMWVGAKGIETIEKIMKMADGGSPANVNAAPAFDLDKVNEMQFAVDQYGQPKMDDPKYAAKVREMRASLMK